MSVRAVNRQGGFSLLEVLVAFAILSVSLGVLLQVFGTGLRNTALAEDYTLAVLRAESLLAAIGRETPLAAGVSQGRIDGKFSWRSTVEPYTDRTLIGNLPALPYRVVVEVFWQGPRRTRSVTLETLRLAPLPSTEHGP